MGWLLIGLIILVAVLISKRFLEHRLSFFLFLGLLIFLLFSMYTVRSILIEQGVNYKTPTGMVTAGKVYISWIANLFGNAETLAGNAVKMDWDVNFTNKNNTNRSK